ncbi:SH3 domain-containing protein [Bacillus thuringiensis]|uniref:SH3 domain-containing protein n=1 Tax=Bacillus thuringiensis TaxID=1428 RepID=UPI00211D36BF|nr:SH3 domain-containing protein [Bacillus thuringiensis]
MLDNAQATPQTYEAYTVTADVLRVRTQPNASSSIMGQVYEGQVLKVIGEENGWLKINHNRKIGYVSSKFVRGEQGGNSSGVIGDYYVNASTLNVRSGAGTNYGIISALQKGTKVTVLSEQNGWSKINYNGKNGYISSQYLSKGQVSGGEEAIGDYYVNASTLNVRSGAGTNYGIIGALQKGTKVTVLSEQNGWSKINYNGKNGYISSQYLSNTPASDGSDTNNLESGFIKPASGRYTSEFGIRDGQMHYGLDIASSGTVPVVTAADGKVTRSYYSTSYGNVVFVSHNINGETYTTVYAHLKSRSVSNGQTIKQGQQVGFMGQTGQATGQHLHFEIHKGEWNSQKSNAVNPKLYIN